MGLSRVTGTHCDMHPESKVPALRFLLPAPIRGGPTTSTTRLDSRAAHRKLWRTTCFDALARILLLVATCPVRTDSCHVLPCQLQQFTKGKPPPELCHTTLALSPHIEASLMLLVTSCLFLSHLAKARAHACGPPNEALPALLTVGISRGVSDLSPKEVRIWRCCSRMQAAKVTKVLQSPSALGMVCKLSKRCKSNRSATKSPG